MKSVVIDWLIYVFKITMVEKREMSRPFNRSSATTATRLEPVVPCHRPLPILTGHASFSPLNLLLVRMLGAA